MRCERDSCCANGIFIEPLKFFGLLRLKYYVVYEVRKDADANTDADVDRDTDWNWDWDSVCCTVPLHFD